MNLKERQDSEKTFNLFTNSKSYEKKTNNVSRVFLPEFGSGTCTDRV